MSDAHLVAVSADAELVGQIAAQLLQKTISAPDNDPVSGELQKGRSSALEQIVAGSEEAKK